MKFALASALALVLAACGGRAAPPPQPAAPNADDGCGGCPADQTCNTCPGDPSCPECDVCGPPVCVPASPE